MEARPTGSHPFRQPGADRVLNSQQPGSQQNQIWDEFLEKLFTRSQEQESAQHTTHDAGRDNQPQPLPLSAQVIELGQRAAEITRTQRDGVGHIRGDGGDA